MSKYNYVRQIINPTYEMLSPVIHVAFQTVHDQLKLDTFSHSGVHFSKADFESLEAKGAMWLGAYDADELIGCVAVTFASKVRARLHKLAVIPEKRGTGLGSFLVRHAEREAFARGARKMELVCVANDTGLVNFYTHQRYKLVKEKQHQQSEWRIAFMEKRMTHLIDLVGERVHAYLLPSVAPEMLPKQAFEVVLVYHPDEMDKPSNTGHVIQRSLPEHTNELIWHRHTITEQVATLSTDYETVLLYPSDEAVPLEQYCKARGPEEKPIRLVVIDGTWQQAQKIMLQSPALKALQNVKLVKLPKSQYELRKNQKPMGLCTLESVAVALSEMGFSEIRDHLMKAFSEWMAVGYDRYKG